MSCWAAGWCEPRRATRRASKPYSSCWWGVCVASGTVCGLELLSAELTSGSSEPSVSCIMLSYIALIYCGGVYFWGFAGIDEAKMSVNDLVSERSHPLSGVPAMIGRWPLRPPSSQVSDVSLLPTAKRQSLMSIDELHHAASMREQGSPLFMNA